MGRRAGRSRGGASAVRARTRVPGAAAGVAPESANRRVHFVPFHQRIRAASSGSGYQPAGATGGTSAAEAADGPAGESLDVPPAPSVAAAGARSVESSPGSRNR